MRNSKSTTANQGTGLRGRDLRWPVVLLAGVVLLGQARCIWATDEAYLAGEPPAPLQVSGSDPVPGDVDVPRTGKLVLRLTDRAQPDSLPDGALRLLEGSTEVAAATHVDLIRCEVSVEAASPLAADTEHTLEAVGLVGFSTGAMEMPYAVSFVTGTDASPLSPPPALPFAQVYTEVISPRCVTCHRGSTAPAGLDLSSPDLAESGLRDGRSVYADGRPRYVVPGNHAASYLMHKVLGLPAIWGDAMPPTGGWPIDRQCGSPDPGLRLLADWIDRL